MSKKLVDITREITAPVGTEFMYCVDGSGDAKIKIENIWGTGDMLKSENLSWLTDYATARSNIWLWTTDSPHFAGVNVWHATDTSITRVSAGVVAIEGKTIPFSILPTVNTDWATLTFNLATNNKHLVTIAGNRTLALSNNTNIPAFMINIKQDATGSRTVTWFSGITWAGGTTPTLTTTASKTDSFGFQQISAGVYLGFVIAQNI